MSYASFWEFLGNTADWLGRAWTWLTTPVSDSLGSMLFGDVYTLGGRGIGITPLSLLTIGGVIFVLVARLVHMLNPLS